MSTIYFKEIQKVSLNWKWVLFIALYILMAWALVEQFYEHKYDIPGVISIVFSIVIIVFFNVIILCTKLETEINQNSISYQFKPFHRKPRVIELGDISEIYLRQFKPYKEYGGYGIQRKLKYGQSFTVSGRSGLQIIIKNGKKILIGTQKPKEIETIVKKLI